MSHMNKHMNWLSNLTKSDSGRTIALRSKLSVATINRQIGREELSAENVIAIARGYDQSPVEALALTGYITQEEATGVPQDAVGDLLTDQQLIRILASRIDDDEDAWAGTFTEVVEKGKSEDEPTPRRASDGGKYQLGNVSVFTPERSKDGESVRSQSDDDGTVRDFDWEPGTYAADGSIDEQEAREARGEDPID